ncbi:MAG TPA: RpiB/LacA/LacB family sugar-phosphate isomerase, partial [Myxococcota bacterium]|nr:RpiB/LacA/LacB family sugar-phosphate isomerase [Myxococcota bacterium]
MAKRIALAADHRGVALKRALGERLERAGWTVVDFGTDGPDAVDYPDQAGPAAEAVSRGEVERAIVACGSANGVAYVANRYPRVRAALGLDPAMAEMSRRHNDANVLA